MHYESWCSLSDEELGSRDIAEVNLASGFGLPPTGELDVKALCRQVDDWAAIAEHGIVKARRKRSCHDFPELSDAKYKILIMVTVLQRNLGVGYNRAFSDGEYDATDCRNLFIHGLLAGFGGTCVTMPVLYIAIGRRLGFPLTLVKARGHFFCRWDDPAGEKFNIEGTCIGFGSHSDEYYKNWPQPISERAIREGWYLRSLTRREEFACFLAQRGNCFYDNLLAAEAARAYQRAHMMDPNEPAHHNHWGWAIILQRAVEQIRIQARSHPFAKELRMPLPQNEFEERDYPIVLGHLNRIISNAKAKRTATPRDLVFTEFASASRLSNH